jgi:hypothetical protein
MIAKFNFKWFDLWIGLFWDADTKILYFCPLPMCVFSISWQRCEGSCKKPIFLRRDEAPYCDDQNCIPF